jgi:hypothetical protein
LLSIEQRVMTLKRMGVLAIDEAADLQILFNIRNKAVHQVAEPTADEAREALAFAKKFLERFSYHGEPPPVPA